MEPAAPQKSSLYKQLISTQCGSTVTMSSRVVLRNLRPTTASTDTQRFLVASLITGKTEANSTSGARGEERK